MSNLVQLRLFATYLNAKYTLVGPKLGRKMGFGIRAEAEKRTGLVFNGRAGIDAETQLASQDVRRLNEQLREWATEGRVKKQAAQGPSNVHQTGWSSIHASLPPLGIPTTFSVPETTRRASCGIADVNVISLPCRGLRP